MADGSIVEGLAPCARTRNRFMEKCLDIEMIKNGLKGLLYMSRDSHRYVTPFNST